MHRPLEARQLTKDYGTTRGLAALDLELEAGEVLGLLGPNGAGKTTTIRLALDLIRPTTGEVFLFGQAPASPAARARVGYLPGELTLDERMSGRAMLTFLEELQAPSSGTSRRRDSLCERFGLSSTDLARSIREYSRGMKQKVGLVSAFQHAPELLILDEPTGGLDPLVREAVLELIEETRAEGRTVLYSSHVLSEVERTCDRIAILRDGELVLLDSVAAIRRSLARRMVVEFRGTVPTEALVRAGATVLETGGARLVLQVSGELSGILRVLAEHDVEQLVFPEPELEDAFLELYGRTEAHP